MDILTGEQRRTRMSTIRQRRTAPERSLARALRARGFRLRFNVSRLPGSPDLVLYQRRVAIFVHGCFWHGHSCRAGKLPATNVGHWSDKIAANRSRDRRKARLLRAAGWHVFTVWGCSLTTVERVAAMAARLMRRIERIAAVG